MSKPTMPAAEQVSALPNLTALPSASRHSYLLQVTPMADGTRLCLPVNVLIGEHSGPTLLMVAGVHGNEYEGIMAQLELWEELAPEEISGVVLMVPVANPPAFRAGFRRNPEDMIDMNRAFPGRMDGAVTEQLAYRLYHDVATRADMVLSMHGWMHGALVLPYVEYPRGMPTTGAARSAARIFGPSYIEGLDWHPGLLVAACTQAGIPAIEPEIGGLACTMPERRAQYKQGTYNLMRHLGMLPGEVQVPGAVQEVTREMLFAPLGGVLQRHKELGDPVRPGGAVATIRDLNGAPLAVIESPVEGIVAAQLLTAKVDPGDLVAVIFMPQEGS